MAQKSKNTKKESTKVDKKTKSIIKPVSKQKQEKVETKPVKEEKPVLAKQPEVKDVKKVETKSVNEEKPVLAKQPEVKDVKKVETKPVNEEKPVLAKQPEVQEVKKAEPVKETKNKLAKKIESIRFTNTSVNRLIRQILMCLIFIFNLVFLFVPLKMPDFGGNGILISLFLYQINSAILATTILSGGAVVACLVGLYLIIRKQKTRSTVPFIAIIANGLVFCFNATNDALSIGMIVVNVLSMICAFALIALNLITYIGNRVEKPEKKYTYCFIINCVTFLVTLSLLFIPFNLANSSGIFASSNWMLGSLIYADGTFTFSFIGALLFAFGLVINLMLLDGCMRYYLENRNAFVKRSLKMNFYNLFLSLGFLVYIFIKTIVEHLTQKNTDSFVTIFYLPFLLNSVLMVLQNFIIGRKEKPTIPTSATPIEKAVINAEIEHNHKINIYRGIFLSCQLLLLGAFIACLFVKFLIVSGSGETGSASYSYTAYELMLQFATGDLSYRIVGFLFLSITIINAGLYVMSTCAILSGSRSADSLCYGSIITLACSVGLIGISSLYFLASIRSSPNIVAAFFPEEFSQQIAEWLSQYTNAVKVGSETLGPCIGMFVVILALLIAKPLTRIQKENARYALAHTPSNVVGGNAVSTTPNEEKDDDTTEKVSLVDDNAVTFDACPSFTELDNKKDDFDKDLSQRQAELFQNPTLPKLVTFVVDYAYNSRLHLSYRKEDIATFVAGLGATKLSILQGMSGTGKTSLPKIFMEAIWGNCEIVEIESSWRDKNELLGYYNEFSHLYSPKKFTRALYKAALNPEIVTFIVLDEMNLSRIEYYFSDFLSLMENEEDKREIRLLNNQIFNTYDKESHSYLALKDNHTIVIPKNVWFVGTANRDESTFEISDKVYDRAYTMNFNRRAPAVTGYKDPMDHRFLDYSTFRKLLYHVPSMNFSIEESPVILEVEKALAQYNISFGNRILRQMETFINIYCNCFPNPGSKLEEALETILLSKVIHKLEYKNVTNKEELVHLFKKLKLNKCVEFVGRLSEDL